MKKLLLAIIGAILIFFSLVNTAEAVQIDGETKSLGDGIIRSWVNLDSKGNPSDIGIAFTPGILSLPTGSNAPFVKTEVGLPLEASTMAFNHIDVDYLPHVVPPLPAVLNVPTFRFHFFLLSSNERNEICPNPDTTGNFLPKCTGDELKQVIKVPERSYIPQGFNQPPRKDPFFAEPRFGMRFLDPKLILPIVFGKERYKTAYYYGFYDGKMSGLGVLFTKPFLDKKSNATYPIKQPDAFPKNGYYPTEYRVSYDADSQEYRISLSGLTFYSATSISAAQPEIALNKRRLTLLSHRVLPRTTLEPSSF